MIIWVVKLFFVQFFYVFLLPLLNIFCFCRSTPFLSFIEPIFAWNAPLVSLIFLKRSLVFPILLFSSISLHWSLRKAFLSLLGILWNSAFRCLYVSFSPLLFTSLRTKLVEVMEFQLSYSKSWKMMLWKCFTQYASKFGKLSSGHRTGKGKFSFQSQRRAMPKNAQTTAQLHLSHTLVK